MEFRGILKVTLLDYPGKIAAIVFVGGCNFRCGYCYSPNLVLRPQELEPIPEEKVLEYLRTEGKNWLDGLVVSGGEPTLQPELPSFLEKVKALGYSVKLDTNGSNPGMLAKLLEKRLVDYVALDVKAPLEKEAYERVIGIPDSAPYRGAEVNGVVERIKRSVEIIQKSGVDYEFRTTVIPGLLDKDSIDRIAEQIKGARRYFIQQFRLSEHVDPRYSSMVPYPPSYLLKIKKHIAPCFQSCEARGIADG